MVINSSDEGVSTPFDSSLYGTGVDPATPASEFAIDYTDCSGVVSFFTTSDDVAALLPEGIEPYTDPVQAGILVADYSFSTIGRYQEYLSVIQVSDMDGELAYYIPYIYVTTDSALVAGRELAGAPKKLADITIDWDLDVVQATLERPGGTRLASLTGKPEDRLPDVNPLEDILPQPTPLLSIRHLPPVEGGDGLTQLVKWSTRLDFKESEKGLELWMGETSVNYPSRTAADPVHKIEVRETLMGMYSNFDMTLEVDEVQKEWSL